MVTKSHFLGKFSNDLFHIKPAKFFHNIYIFWKHIFVYFFIFFNNIFKISSKKHQKNNFLRNFLTFFYIFLISVLNFGHYNLSLLFSFITSFYCTNKLSFNLVVFLEQKWYTLLTKFKNKLGFRKRINASKRKEI